jgi:hypothetical protein
MTKIGVWAGEHRRSLIWAFAIVVTAAAVIFVFRFGFADQPTEQNIVAEWNDTIRKLGIEPVFQERKIGDDAEKRFFVACHVERANCEKARGSDNPTPGTSCSFIDLTAASWRPSAGGLYNSLYQFSASSFPAPFPQI